MADVFSIMEQIATCLCEQIEEDGLMTPCFCGVIPGTAPVYGYFDDSCQGGMAWVRLITMYPSVSIGQQQITGNNCQSGLGFDIEVGVLRPVDVGDEDGNMPDDATIIAQAGIQLADAITMRKAIACCGINEGWILGAYTPMGPQGGVAGGNWVVNVGDF